MLSSRDSPNNCDDIDVLLLDWSFLRIPLESLSISVRQMHKALDADGMRLTAFLTRQFSSPSFNKQQPQHTELADARKPTTEETQEERETNQCSVPVQVSPQSLPYATSHICPKYDRYQRFSGARLHQMVMDPVSCQN